jgi:alkylation response protein AidB-like acyl-CoA dehydrogenase
MDWSDTPDQAQFRARVRSLIDERLPQRYRELAKETFAGERQWEYDRKSDVDEARQSAQEWAKALSEHNWVAPHWPAEYGGGGLKAMEQFIFNQEMAETGAPTVGGSAVGLFGPTLVLHGTDEQKEKFLPPIVKGEVTWAQGYSEPGAGSDLAGLATRATRDGDDYIVNGQKIWTSAAHLSDSIFALVRTDPDAPKHRGISFLIFDSIKLPGISIRPLTDMGGNHYFNEVFFEDVRVPARNIVGDENRGWYVAMTLLDYERSNIAGAVHARKTINGLLSYLKTSDGQARSRISDLPVLRDEIVSRYIETEVMYNFSFRVISIHTAGQIPNYEASMSKLFNSELSQRLARTGCQVFGLYAYLNEERSPGDNVAVDFARADIRMVPATIRGGTSEIQRNIIATRGLSLPRG